MKIHLSGLNLKKKSESTKIFGVAVIFYLGWDATIISNILGHNADGMGGIL